MTICDDFINRMKKNLPDPAGMKDLIKVGLYKNSQAARSARIHGSAPPYFKLGKRFLYPKDGVLEWLQKNKHADS